MGKLIDLLDQLGRLNDGFEDVLWHVTLECKLCGNKEDFIARGKVTSYCVIYIDGSGKVNEGVWSDDDDAVYTSVECEECDAETDNIKGAKEWLERINGG